METMELSVFTQTEPLDVYLVVGSCRGSAVALLPCAYLPPQYCTERAGAAPEGRSYRGKNTSNYETTSSSRAGGQHRGA